MFEELGLNTARQDDNGANPRPDNRSGWLDGSAPDTPMDRLINRREEAPMWDPASQLRHAKKTSVPPRPDGAPNRGHAPDPDEAPTEECSRSDPGGSGARGRISPTGLRGKGDRMTDIQERIEELKDRGLYRRMRLISGPQGPRVLLDGKPVLLLCSNNYLGLADHPRVRQAAADAAMRWGVGAGASRLVSGNMTVHRRLEDQLAEFKGTPRCVLFGSGYLANMGVIGALAGDGDVVFSDSLNHASIVDGCRLAKAETFVYKHCDTDHLEWGLRKAEGRGSLIVTDGIFSMDGDLAPLERIVEIARRYDARVMVDEAHATGTTGPVGAAPSPRPGSRTRST